MKYTGGEIMPKSSIQIFNITAFLLFLFICFLPSFFMYLLGMLDITYYVTDTKMYLACLFVLWEKRLLKL